MSPTTYPIFDYTSGDPDNLVGSEDASMTDIQGPFYDVRTFLNSGVIQQVARDLLIVGEVRFVAVAAAPALWLACDGAAVSRATYNKLFVAIGTVYGAGDGVNTFNVPDLRGRVAAGAGQGTGLVSRVIGTQWGVEAVVLAVGQVPAHNHYAAGVDHLHSAGSLATTDHLHGLNISTGTESANTSVQSLAGGPLGLARSAHGHSVVGATGAADRYLSVAGATAAADRSLAFYTAGMNVTALAATHDNTQPSLAIPAYVYAGQ